MVKLVGGLCILSGGILAVLRQAEERRRRMDTLSDLLAALRRMGEEIRMARTPLPDLLETLAAGCGAEAAAFFHDGAEAARVGGDLADTWRRGAETLPLSREDRTALAELGNDLRGDEESVCKAISIVSYKLAKSMEESVRHRPEEEKRATALCLSGAALLVILLI